MPELTKTEHRQRASAIRVARGMQPVEHLMAAGCCPSVTIVDYGLPTQHVVYCEKEHTEESVDRGAGFHRGLAGVDVPGWRTAPVPWQWA